MTEERGWRLFYRCSERGLQSGERGKVITQRRELFVDYEIPLGEAYREFVLRFLDGD